MTEPIDHAVEAMKAVESAHLWQESEGSTDATQLADVLIAQTHATLALVAAQDRANELKRIEILAHISYGPTILDENRSATVAESEVWQALHDQTGQHDPLAPSIAASLGLGGESDDR